MSNTALFAVLIAGLIGLAFLFGGPPDGNEVSFAFKNLPDLPRGFVYQAWVLDDQDGLVSLGRFRRIGNAKNFSYFGELHRQKKFLISLETGDPDGVGDLNETTPDLILFAGDINPLKNIVHLSLIAPDLESPSGGVFMLRTPTDNSNHADSKLKDGVDANDFNDDEGIWFVTFDGEPGEFTPTSGLSLPRIPTENFAYEGWVIHNRTETYVTTGRFIDPNLPDRNSGQSIYDGGRVYLGPMIPGEDFVNPGIAAGSLELPLSLNEGWRTSISIEPNSDDVEMPFVLVPWSTPIGFGNACFADTITNQPNPNEYQKQKCVIEPQYDGVAVIH